MSEAKQGKRNSQDASDEQADILLEKIKAEKERLREKGIYNSGIKLIEPKDRNIQFFELPQNWSWCYLNDVITFITDYQSNGSFASLSENVKIYRASNYAILVRLTDLRRKNLTDGELIFTDEHGYNYLKKSSLHGGEILVANVGSVGTAVLMPELKAKCSIAPNMFIVKLSEHINKEFFTFFSQSSIYWEDLKRLIRGGSQPKINKNQYRSIAIPLPPLAEQERIVAKLEKLMKFCDELEANIKQGITNADQLLQTALKEALEPR